MRNTEDNVIYDVCIIGAGMSGMIAAIEAAKKGLKVIICDRNKKYGTKLYATGNGRCNLANTYLDEKSYYNNSFALNVLGVNPCEFTREYFINLGIMTYDKQGYVYPKSNQASSVVWALTDMLKSLKVSVRFNTEIVSIKHIGKNFAISSKSDNIHAKNIILAAGGVSQKKLGVPEENTLYMLYDSLGLKYNTFKPSLTALETNRFFSKISGVRVSASAEIFIDGIMKDREKGELQITESGLSGIMIFNLSHYFETDKTCMVKINLIEDINKEDITGIYNDMLKEAPEKKLKAFLNGFINDKLAEFFIEDTLGQENINITLKETNINLIKKIIDKMSSWNIEISGAAGFDKSQVSKGGIITDIISKDTMEIKNKKGIYAVGETVDTDGKCGGYNLMWAVKTGYLAGRAVK